jgi:uncharacterized membrane protein
MVLQNRRGMTGVIVAVMMTTLLAVSAVTIDSNRLHSLRNELQFSADAGAHAGAIQLMEPNDPMTTADVAAAYSTRYLAMQGVVHVDSVELGAWDDFNHAFTPGLMPPNAVRVVVSRRAAGLLVSTFGVNSPTIRAHAVGWLPRDSSTTARRVILAQ